VKKLIIFLSLLLVLSFTMLGATSCGEEGPTEPVVLRVAMDRPPGSFDTVLLEEWWFILRRSFVQWMKALIW
jgi:hypothetical protein